MSRQQWTVIVSWKGNKRTSPAAAFGWEASQGHTDIWVWQASRPLLARFEVLTWCRLNAEHCNCGCVWGGVKSAVSRLVALKCTRHLWNIKRWQWQRYMWVVSEDTALVKFRELTTTVIYLHVVYITLSLAMLTLCVHCHLTQYVSKHMVHLLLWKKLNGVACFLIGVC